MKKQKYFIVVFIIGLCSTVWSCKELTEPILDHQTVTLEAPASGVKSGDSTQIFYWDYLPDSARYELEVVSPRFDSIVRLAVDTVIEKNQFILNLKPGDYQWRVRAMNYSSVSKYSEIWKLTIQQ